MRMRVCIRLIKNYRFSTSVRVYKGERERERGGIRKIDKIL